MAGNSQPAGGSAPNGGKQNDTRTLIYFMIMALIVTSIINVFMASISNRSFSEICPILRLAMATSYRRSEFALFCCAVASASFASNNSKK